MRTNILIYCIYWFSLSINWLAEFDLLYLNKICARFSQNNIRIPIKQTKPKRDSNSQTWYLRMTRTNWQGKKKLYIRRNPAITISPVWIIMMLGSLMAKRILFKKIIKDTWSRKKKSKDINGQKLKILIHKEINHQPLTYLQICNLSENSITRRLI